MSYLAATALASDGSWHHPSGYTPLLSRVLKCGQLVLAADACDYDYCDLAIDGDHLEHQVKMCLANDKVTPLSS